MNKTWRTDLANMVYIIRDEKYIPLEHLMGLGIDRKIIENNQGEFMSSLSSMFELLFDNAIIVVIDIFEQLEKANRDLFGKKTLSLDTYFKGTYNIEATRLFEIVNKESKIIRLTNRVGSNELNEQIANIVQGDYIIVDDDAVGGRTIREIESMLPVGVNVVDKYLMIDAYRKPESEPILDVVDSRDFIAGSTGGLTVKLKAGEIVRAPYMYPFVDIEDKANIPKDQCIKVSQQIWELNIKLWGNMGKDIRVSDTKQDFVNLCNYFQIEKDALMVKACETFYRLSEKGIMI